MKLTKLLSAGVVFSAVAGLAILAQQTQLSGTNMVTAAEKFLATLPEAQKKQATYSYDSKERTNWNFIPLQDPKTRKYTRNGLPLEEMNPEQRKAALALVKAGTSEKGNLQATTIMTLEAILKEHEKDKGAMVRNQEWYFFTIFGTPSATGKWGWRCEGHHLSMNFTMDGTQVVAATPTFFGANPAEIKQGSNKGLRILNASEDTALALYKSLTDDQKKTADKNKEFPKGFPEPGQKELDPKVGAPLGVAASGFSAEQKELLNNLLKAYTERMPSDVAELEWKHVREGGLDKIHFAFTGTPVLGKAHTYRVQGPSFVIEFLNQQADAQGNAANHIHSCWRSLTKDFGL